jgi:hypothetical protein
MCQGCATWGPGQQPPPKDPNPEDCGKPSVSNCIEGCKYAHGAPPDPFPPPCAPGSFSCPGVDPAFDSSKVLFAGNFADGMVLQRGPASAALYGTATPGAHVEVELTNPTSGFSWKAPLIPVRADGDHEHHGTWKVLLPAQPAGGGYTLSASCTDCKNSTATATAVGVLFGDVWVVRSRICFHRAFFLQRWKLVKPPTHDTSDFITLSSQCSHSYRFSHLQCSHFRTLQCSGQSNMEAMVDVTFARNESYAAVDAGNYSNIRMFQVAWRPMKNATYILPQSSTANRPKQVTHSCAAMFKVGLQSHPTPLSLSHTLSLTHTLSLSYSLPYSLLQRSTGKYQVALHYLSSRRSAGTSAKPSLTTQHLRESR